MESSSSRCAPRAPHIAIDSIEGIDNDLPTTKQMDCIMERTAPKRIDCLIIQVKHERFSVLLRVCDSSNNLRDILSHPKSEFAHVREALWEMAGLFEKEEYSLLKNLAIRRARKEEATHASCCYPTRKGTPCKIRTGYGAGCSYHARDMMRLCAYERGVAETLLVHVQKEFVKQVWRPNGPTAKAQIMKDIQEE